MPYLTQADLETLFSLDELLSIADRDGDGEVDNAVVEAAIADASALADSYLAERYVTPVTPTPAVLRRQVAAIARHFLWKDGASELVKDDRDAAVRWLRDIAGGSASLPGSGANAAPATASTILVDAPPAQFGPGSLRDW